jgi:hypothetical protein
MSGKRREDAHQLKPKALIAGRARVLDFLRTQETFEGGKIFPCLVTLTPNYLPDRWFSYILTRYLLDTLLAISTPRLLGLGMF